MYPVLIHRKNIPYDGNDGLREKERKQTVTVCFDDNDLQGVNLRTEKGALWSVKKKRLSFGDSGPKNVNNLFDALF